MTDQRTKTKGTFDKVYLLISGNKEGKQSKSTFDGEKMIKMKILTNRNNTYFETKEIKKITVFDLL